MAKTDLMWGIQADGGGRAGPLKRGRKASKLTLEGKERCLLSLLCRRQAWPSRDGSWGDWRQGCRGLLREPRGSGVLGRSACLCGGGGERGMAEERPAH